MLGKTSCTDVMFHFLAYYTHMHKTKRENCRTETITVHSCLESHYLLASLQAWQRCWSTCNCTVSHGSHLVGATSSLLLPLYWEYPNLCKQQRISLLIRKDDSKKNQSKAKIQAMEERVRGQFWSEHSTDVPLHHEFVQPFNHWRIRGPFWGIISLSLFRNSGAHVLFPWWSDFLTIKGKKKVLASLLFN